MNDSLGPNAPGRQRGNACDGQGAEGQGSTGPQPQRSGAAGQHAASRNSPNQRPFGQHLSDPSSEQKRVGHERRPWALIAAAVIGFVVLAGGAFAAASALIGSDDGEPAAAPVDPAIDEDTDSGMAGDDGIREADHDQVVDTITPVTPEASRPAEIADPEPPQSPGWDELKDAEIPGFCLHEPSRLVDGVDPNVPDGEGWFELRQTTYTGDPGIVTDLESPNGPLTAVVASCNAGGTGIPSLILFFGDGGKYVASTFLNQGSAAGEYDPNDDWSSDWAAVGLSFAGRDGVRSIRADGDVLIVHLDAYLPDDPLAKASATAEVQVRVEDGIVHLVDIQRTT